jgi:hypothetical protein
MPFLSSSFENIFYPTFVFHFSTPEHAEPLTDTANSVLHRLLFNTSSQTSPEYRMQPITKPLTKPPIYSGMPKALTQIIEVVYEVVKMNRSRPDATTVVSKRHGTSPQTILDKYCRQLHMKAHDFDELLAEPGLPALIGILKERFPRHHDYIDSFLDSLPSQPPRLTVVESKAQGEPETDRRHVYIRTPQTPTAGTVYGARKKRDPELEKILKESLGSTLKENWGSFSLEGRSLLDFGDKRILCKYSSFSQGQAKWFWGVSKKHWDDWQDTDYLALILEDGIKGYSYLLFNSEEARRLFNICSVSKDGEQKKISMRIYADDDKPHLQDWQSFDVEGRMRELNTDRQ